MLCLDGTVLKTNPIESCITTARLVNFIVFSEKDNDATEYTCKLTASQENVKLNIADHTAITLRQLWFGLGYEQQMPSVSLFMAFQKCTRYNKYYPLSIQLAIQEANHVYTEVVLTYFPVSAVRPSADQVGAYLTSLPALDDGSLSSQPMRKPPEPKRWLGLLYGEKMKEFQERARVENQTTRLNNLRKDQKPLEQEITLSDFEKDIPLSPSSSEEEEEGQEDEQDELLISQSSDYDRSPYQSLSEQEEFLLNLKEKPMTKRAQTQESDVRNKRVTWLGEDEQQAAAQNSSKHKPKKDPGENPAEDKDEKSMSDYDGDEDVSCYSPEDNKYDLDYKEGDSTKLEAISTQRSKYKKAISKRESCAPVENKDAGAPVVEKPDPTAPVAEKPDTATPEEKKDNSGPVEKNDSFGAKALPEGSNKFKFETKTAAGKSRLDIVEVQLVQALRSLNVGGVKKGSLADFKRLFAENSVIEHRFYSGLNGTEHIVVCTKKECSRIFKVVLDKMGTDSFKFNRVINKGHSFQAHKDIQEIRDAHQKYLESAQSTTQTSRATKKKTVTEPPQPQVEEEKPGQGNQEEPEEEEAGGHKIEPDHQESALVDDDGDEVMQEGGSQEDVEFSEELEEEASKKKPETQAASDANSKKEEAEDEGCSSSEISSKLSFLDDDEAGLTEGPPFQSKWETSFTDFKKCFKPIPPDQVQGVFDGALHPIHQKYVKVQVLKPQQLEELTHNQAPAKDGSGAQNLPRTSGPDEPKPASMKYQIQPGDQVVGSSKQTLAQDSDSQFTRQPAQPGPGNLEPNQPSTSVGEFSEVKQALPPAQHIDRSKGLESPQAKTQTKSPQSQQKQLP